MRFLLYSHDSYGLGHIRRTIAVVEGLLWPFQPSSALVLTGAPRAHYLTFPPHCDYIKLPSVTKSFNGHYRSREISLTLRETVELRSRLICEAAGSFRPDVVLVDHSPMGLCGEVQPLLENLASGQRRVLRIYGMRDIIDEPERVHANWSREQVLPCLRDSYDSIFVYGQQDLFDPIEAYGIPAEIAQKMVFTGYLARHGSTVAPEQLRQRFAPRTGRLVTVTVGGGGDGSQPLRAFLRGFEALGPRPPFEALLITGPLMQPRKRKRLIARTERIQGVTTLEFFVDLPALYRASDFVVAMGGHNTVCELAAVGARALLLPRTYPRREQLLRAQLLAARGLCSFLSPQQVTPGRLMDEIQGGLERPRPPRRWGLELSGQERIGAAIARLTADDMMAPLVSACLPG